MTIDDFEEFRITIDEALDNASSNLNVQYEKEDTKRYLYNLAKVNGVTLLKDIDMTGVHLTDVTTWNEKTAGQYTLQKTIINHSVAKLFKTAAEKAFEESRAFLTQADWDYAFIFWHCKVPPFCKKK